MFVSVVLQEGGPVLIIELVLQRKYARPCPRVVFRLPIRCLKRLVVFTRILPVVLDDRIRPNDHRKIPTRVLFLGAIDECERARRDMLAIGEFGQIDFFG